MRRLTFLTPYARVAFWRKPQVDDPKDPELKRFSESVLAYFGAADAQFLHQVGLASEKWYKPNEDLQVPGSAGGTEPLE